MKNALALLAGSLLSSHAAEISVTASPDGNWVHLIPAGTFSGRDGRGPYHAGDEASLQQIAAMTRQYHGANDIVIDYEHQSLNSQSNGQPAPASGWIKEVQARPDGLYGRVEWTAQASAAIKAKEYRYLSPVYFYTKEGQVLALQNVALTNSPNLHLPEVAAHSIFSATKPAEVSMKRVLAALGLSDGASESDVLVAINSMLTSSTAIAVAAGLTTDAKSEQIALAVQTAFADRKKIAIAAGQPETATTEQLVAVFSAAHSTNTPDPTKFVPVDALVAVQNSLNELKKTIGDDKAKEAVETAVRDGKLPPALREWGLALHRTDPTQFAAYVGAAPVLTAAQRSTGANITTGPIDLTEADRAVMRQMGLSEEAMKNSKTAMEARR